MGQWGESMFESDGVLDFLTEFHNSKDFTLIENAVNNVLESEDYLDVDDCYNVIAAAEIVAAIKGHKSAEFPHHLDFTVTNFEEKINDKLIKTIKKALKKVLTQEDSELFELWDDPDSLKEYYENLIERII